MTDDRHELEVRVDAILRWCEHVKRNQATAAEAVVVIEGLALACKEYLHGGKAA